MRRRALGDDHPGYWTGRTTWAWICPPWETWWWCWPRRWRGGVPCWARTTRPPCGQPAHALRLRIDTLAEATGVDRTKAHAWAFNRSIDDALWGHAQHDAQFRLGDRTRPGPAIERL